MHLALEAPAFSYKISLSQMSTVFFFQFELPLEIFFRKNKVNRVQISPANSVFASPNKVYGSRNRGQMLKQTEIKAKYSNPTSTKAHHKLILLSTW